MIDAAALSEPKKVTAFFEVRKSYRRVLELGFVGAVIIHAALFYFSPPYVPHPYTFPEKKLQVLNLPEGMGEVPPLPEDVARPELPGAAAISDDVSPDVTIAPTEFNPFSPPVIPARPESPDVFFAYDSPPALIRSLKPEYPDVAREAGAEGSVLVEITIDETGRVIDARVIKSDTIASLNNAALEAVRKFLFKPAKQRDVPVRCRIVVPFRFSLSD